MCWKNKAPAPLETMPEEEVEARRWEVWTGQASIIFEIEISGEIENLRD